mgnify:CR=1 FL=1
MIKTERKRQEFDEQRYYITLCEGVKVYYMSVDKKSDGKSTLKFGSAVHAEAILAKKASDYFSLIMRHYPNLKRDQLDAVPCISEIWLTAEQLKLLNIS